jgi:hypothetical protein
MSLYQGSNDDLSLLISAAVGGTVASADYTVLALRPTTSADLPASGGKNTKIAIQMNPSSQYQGQINLFYDRLDLSQLTQFSPIVSLASAGTPIASMLNQLRDTFGINFTAAELANTSTVDDGTGTGACNLTITALSTSLGWINSVTVKFAPLPNISTAFLGNVLTGF